MNKIIKEQITNKLFEYCERFESRNKAANSLKDVSAATISHILNKSWDYVGDTMWRNVATQIGYKTFDWQMVETTDHRLLNLLFNDAKDNSLVMAITGNAGTGKTFTIKHYVESNRGVYALHCAEYWNKKQFLQELMMVIGLDYHGLSLGEMMHAIVRQLKTSESPLIILDEADKLSDSVLYFFITLYNQLEDECGIILIATSHLDKHLQRGVDRNVKGYNEIWSRVGRRCIPMHGVTRNDITAICEANGVTGSEEIESIITDCNGDLRRVKRRIHAAKVKATTRIGDVKIEKTATN